LTYARKKRPRDVFLFEGEVGFESQEVIFGEFRQCAQVVDGGESYMFPPEGVDSFSLFKSQVGVAVQPLRAAVVDRYGAYIFRVRYEMVCERVEMQVPEGFVGELPR